MRRFTRSISFMLVLSLLLALCACAQRTDPTATAATKPTTATPPTTDVPNEGLILYQAARAVLENQENVGLVVSVTETMSLPAEEIVTNLKQDISYLGRGTDHFEAVVQDTSGNSYGSLRNKEIYSGGKVFITSYDGHYLSNLTEEEFIARYLPVILIDENLYSSCNYTVGDYSTEIRFSDGTAPESWLPEKAEIMEASGTAVINTAGKLTKYTYDVTYFLLGATIQQEISVVVTTPQVMQADAPSDTSDYLSLPHPDVVKLADLAYYRVLASTSISCSVMNETVSHAGAIRMVDVQEIETYDDGSYMAQLDFSRQYTDMQTTESGGFQQKEIFRNNTYTISNNGGTATTNPNVYQKMMQDYISGEIIYGWVDYGYMTECEITNLGNILLIEFKGNDELGRLIEDDISYELFENEAFLDDLASKYVTKQMDFYIAIDTYLGLPTAAGFVYGGSHTIEGTEYWISRTVSSSIHLASSESYKAITGNATPDTEEAESPTPLFYHVTGKNGEEMWLLGTIHVGDARTGKLPQKIMDAFYASDALALECNPEAMEEEMKDPAVSNEYANAYYYSDGTTAQDHISDSEMYYFAMDLMKATGFYNYLMPYLKTSLWENSISNEWTRMTYTLSSDKGVDNRLLQLAESHNKPIREVESNLFQIKMLTGWSDALSESLLAAALSYDLDLHATELMELYTMWCEGDESALAEYLKDDLSDATAEEKALWEEYNKAMSTDRNKHMAEVAIEYLESGETVFYAVGLAHILAEDGLVNALRDAGYTVELVTYE